MTAEEQRDMSSRLKVVRPARHIMIGDTHPISNDLCCQGSLPPRTKVENHRAWIPVAVKLLVVSFNPH